MAIIKRREDLQPISSNDIKNALCRYFYNKKGCIYFGKEFDLGNNYRADFISGFEHWEKCKRVWRVIEIEVKVSWADFMKDFTNKKSKHDSYCNGYNQMVNYFAFCVPLELYDKCKAFLDINYPKYGLFIYSNESACQSTGSQFADKKLLTPKDLESNIKKESIVRQMAIHVIYPK